MKPGMYRLQEPSDYPSTNSHKGAWFAVIRDYPAGPNWDPPYHTENIDLYFGDIVLIFSCAWVEGTFEQAEMRSLRSVPRETRVRMLYRGKLATYYVPNIPPEDLFEEI